MLSIIVFFARNISNNTICYENIILAMRAAFMRQGSLVIILLHLGIGSVCSGSYLRTEEPDPTLKALCFLSAVKREPFSLGG